jgi:hypothetical protein
VRKHTRVLQHIRFADYWSSANGNFSEVKGYTREIARDAGLELDANEAFQWLGTGGFVEMDMNRGGLGTVSLLALHQITRRFSERPATVAVDGTNWYQLRLEGSTESTVAFYHEGKVQSFVSLRREGKVLPIIGMFKVIRQALEESPDFEALLAYAERRHRAVGIPFDFGARLSLLEALEGMIRDGWIEAHRSGWGQGANFAIPDDTPAIAANRDPRRD